MLSLILSHSSRIILFGLILLGLVQSGYAKKYSACQGKFTPNEGICAKFKFGDGHQRECITPKNGTTYYNLSKLPKVTSIDDRTRKMSSLITNVFEEGSTNFAFASCVDIGDLRGYTCGYVGFTTGTNDAETVIKAYSKKNPNNAFKPYLSKLAKISALPFCDRTGRGTTKGLEGFSKAWKTEACRKGEAFPKVQKDWAYNNYMLPSARYAAAYGVNSALGRAIFYDTIIQHGYQYVEQDINIVRVLTLTGGRKKNETEQSFLTRFLTTRRELQCCYPDDVWPDSATRSEDLQGLVSKFSTNKDLAKPVKLKNFGVTVKGTEQDLIDTRRCKK